MHLQTQLQDAEQNVLRGPDVSARPADRSLGRVPVHIRSSLLHHGFLSIQNLLRVQDVEEVDRHEERHREVLPHGVGEVVLRVDHRVLTGNIGERQEKEEIC